MGGGGTGSMLIKKNFDGIQNNKQTNSATSNIIISFHIRKANWIASFNTLAKLRTQCCMKSFRLETLLKVPSCFIDRGISLAVLYESLPEKKQVLSPLIGKNKKLPCQSTNNCPSCSLKCYTYSNCMLLPLRNLIALVAGVGDLDM